MAGDQGEGETLRRRDEDQARGRGGKDEVSMTTVGIDGNSFKQAHRMSQKVGLNVTLEWGRIPGEFALF